MDIEIRQKPPHATATAHAEDAIDLLTADHKAVMQLFEDYHAQKGSGNGAAAGLVKRICTELTVHTQIEEEIFYPAVQGATQDDALIERAQEEHADVKALIDQIEQAHPDDPQYDDLVRLLEQDVAQHVSEEQEEMFVRARRAGLDTLDLGERLTQRKSMLFEELRGVKPS